MTATDAPARTRAGLLARFASFIAERYPFALRPAVTALDMAIGGDALDERDAAAVDALRTPLRRLLPQTLSDSLTPDATAAQKLKGEVPETGRMALSAQMGKAGSPMNGKDLHVGDREHGVLPAMAPLGGPALTIAGIAMAFHLRKEDRVAVSFVGEGATSLGEWHQAINACAARKLPAIFCVQNNQTALSTPVSEQSSVRVFAEKAAGYGIPSITIDGTDPEAIAAAFA